MAHNREQVLQYLRERMTTSLTAQGKPVGDLSESFNFMDADVLDSLGFVSLIHELEGKFGFELDLSDADPEELATLGGLADAAVQAAPGN